MAESVPTIVSLFPLPNVVLFPKTFLPLHIFEPRYKQMVEDALVGDRQIGMVLLREGWEQDYDHAPAIHAVGCAGEIVFAQRLEDARFNIVLRGMFRFRVAQEIAARLYRQAAIQPLDALDQDPGLPPLLRTELITVLQDYARKRSWQRTVAALLERGLEDALLVNLLSGELDFTPDEKQFLLTSDDLIQQCKRLIQLIGFHREVDGARATPPNRTEPGGETPRPEAS